MIFRLVRLVARAFYDDYTTKSDNQQKSARSDNRGIAAVVLDALARFVCISSIFILKSLLAEY
jgi:transcription initiation factor TFIIE subunit alpha